MKTKHIIIAACLFLLSTSGFSQTAKFAGSWYGTLNVGVDLRIVFHITQEENGPLPSGIVMVAPKLILPSLLVYAMSSLL